MSVNIQILNNTEYGEIELEKATIFTNRRNAKIFRDKNVFFINSDKLVNHFRIGGNLPRIEKLMEYLELSRDIGDYRFARRYSYELRGRRLFVYLYNMYRAVPVIYRTKSYYKDIPNQIVGFQFEDSKKLMMFKLKFSHIFNEQLQEVY